jgi:hypothetical protein
MPVSARFRPFRKMRLPVLAIAVLTAAAGHGQTQDGKTPTKTRPTQTEAALSDREITGHFIGMGALCPQFRLQTGEEIGLEALPNDITTMPEGRLLRFSGQFARASRCQQGRAFLADALLPDAEN